MFFSSNLLQRRAVSGARSNIASSTWALLGFIAFTSIALLGLTASNIIDQRAAIMAEGRKETTNLARTLIQHAEFTFRSADNILIGIVERLEHDSFGPTAGSA